MRRAYVDIAEGQMHYRYAGDGEPVILLHMSGSSSDEFEKVGDILANDHRVYAPDLLAFGYSDRPPCVYTMQQHAETIIEFMESLNIKSAFFVGNLVGANISVHVALLCPDRVKGMFLSSFCYGLDYKEYQKFGDLPVYQPVEVKDDGSHLIELWRRTQRYKESTGVISARTLCMHMAGDWSESLHKALFTDRDLSEELKTISIPVKLIVAPNDEASTRRVSELLQNAQYQVIENLNPFFDRKYPDIFANMVKECL